LSSAARPSSCIPMKMCRLTEKLDGPPQNVWMQQQQQQQQQPQRATSSLLKGQSQTTVSKCRRKLPATFAQNHWQPQRRHVPALPSRGRQIDAGKPMLKHGSSRLQTTDTTCKPVDSFPHDLPDLTIQHAPERVCTIWVRLELLNDDSMEVTPISQSLWRLSYTCVGYSSNVSY